MLAEERVRGTTWVDPSGVWGPSEPAAGATAAIDFKAEMVRPCARPLLSCLPARLR